MAILRSLRFLTSLLRIDFTHCVVVVEGRVGGKTTSLSGIPGGRSGFKCRWRLHGVLGLPLHPRLRQSE